MLCHEDCLNADLLGLCSKLQVSLYELALLWYGCDSRFLLIECRKGGGYTVVSGGKRDLFLLMNGYCYDAIERRYQESH